MLAASRGGAAPMQTYQLLRTARIVLWVAFVISLPLATAFRTDEVGTAALVRYLPPLMLLLALLAGLAERLVRKHYGIATKRLWPG